MDKDESDKVKVVIKDDKLDTAKEENPDSEQIKSPDDVDLNVKLDKEKEKSSILEDKLARTLADFQNLEKNTRMQVQNGIMAKAGEIFADLLGIRDDFERARDSFAENEKNTTGLDSILKNMDSILSKHGVLPMENIGEIFNPQFHEAISVTEDAMLDENTITKIIRKGYILHDKIVRTSLVEISKKPVVD